MLSSSQLPAAYLHQVRRIAPAELEERETELADLATFCTRTDGPAYAWWRAPAWAGKSALLSWFVLHPPAGVLLISFFVTARLSGQGDRAAFVDVVLQQLTEMLGEPMPNYLTSATRETHLLSLLERACPLVLVVDGLDEDLGWTADGTAHSIAALLPSVPPPGLRVIVAGRLDPPLPADVPADHPLRDPTAQRDLTPSKHALVVRHDAHRDLRRLLNGTSLQQDLLGLTAAAGGGLSADELAELTGRGRLEISDELHSVAGRAFQSKAGPVYFFAHQELMTSAFDYLGPARLDALRLRLHAWAGDYADRRWPSCTPGYLIHSYGSLLHSLEDVPRMITLAVDADRHDRMLAVTGGDTAALAEIAVVPATDLRSAARLAVHREELRRRSANLPLGLVEVRARLGQPARAEALARAMDLSGSRALGSLARIAAEAGDIHHATHLAEDITDEAEQAAALLAVARANPLSGADLLERAATVAAQITDAAPRARALGEASVTAAHLGQPELCRTLSDLAESAARSLPNPALLESALSEHIEFVARAGDIARAERLLVGVRDDHRQVWLLSALAENAGSIEDCRRLLAAARRRAEAIDDAQRRAYALTATALGAAASGDHEMADIMIQRAIEAAHQVASTDQRAQALAWVFTARPDLPAFVLEEAVGLASALQDSRHRSATLGHVAIAAAQLDTGRAESIARSISEPADRSRAWREICLAAGRRREFADARRVAQRIDDLHARAQALAYLASCLVDANRLAEASAMADQAETTARSIVASHRLAESLIGLATAMSRLGDRGRAADFLERAERLVNAGQSELTIPLARAMVAAGDHTAAERLARSPDSEEPVAIEVALALARVGKFDQAAALARYYSDIGWRIQALTHLADDLIVAGQIERARDLVEEALTCLNQELAEDAGQGALFADLTRISRNVIGRPCLAKTLARLGDGSGAEAMISTMESPPIIAETATTVACLLAEHGDIASAVRLLDLAERAIEAVSSPKHIAESASEVAAAAVVVGVPSRAVPLLDRAEAAAREVAETTREQVLATVAVNAAKAADFDRAERLVHTTTRPSWESQVRRIGEVANAMTAAGAYQRGKRLVALVDAHRRPAIEASLASILLGRGEVEEALRLARSIADADHAATALAAVAAAASPAQAPGILREALRTGNWLASVETLADLDSAAATAMADEFTFLHDRLQAP